MPLAWDSLEGPLLVTLQNRAPTQSSRGKSEEREDNQALSKTLSFYLAGARRLAMSALGSLHHHESQLIKWPHILSINLPHIVTKTPLPFTYGACPSIWSRQTQVDLGYPFPQKPSWEIHYTTFHSPGNTWTKETAGPCMQLLLAPGQSKSNQPCSEP